MLQLRTHNAQSIASDESEAISMGRTFADDKTKQRNLARLKIGALVLV